MSNQEIKNYYDQLAKDYDRDRFANSYGKFIDHQERNIIRRFWPKATSNSIDLACGTGRLMDFCSVGMDISPAMISQAQDKFPDKTFLEGNVLSGSIELNEHYEAALCFHLIMHLKKEDLNTFLEQVYKILKPGGLLIFDIASQERRNLFRKKYQGWHGANGYTSREISQRVARKWKIVGEEGVLFLPIHQFPKSIRSYFFRIDTLLNKSFLKKYASYRVYVLKKEG